VRLTNFGSAADVSEGPDSLGATFVDAALDAGARTSLDITTLARAQVCVTHSPHDHAPVHSVLGLHWSSALYTFIVGKHPCC
jgi:hypothetical protein